jgi:GH24 family phage-related lysozyme (muramidase)
LWYKIKLQGRIEMDGMTPPSGEVRRQVQAAFEKLMISREGERTDVYKDSRGLLTVGIGHLVLPADKLELGDVISQERVSALFAADGADALDAAWKQAGQAGIASTAFIPYLASVNFQLGTAWTRTFPHTWQMIVDGKYQDAADALNGTLWQKQTPVRVRDFQDALRALPPKP